MVEEKRIPKRRHENPPETVRVQNSDRFPGVDGDFVTINRSSFDPSVHVLYDGSKAVAREVESTPEPNPDSSPSSEQSDDYTVDDLRFMVQGANSEELESLRAREAARSKPRQSAYDVIDKAAKEIEAEVSEAEDTPSEE